ncbi:MAG: 2-hydroxychromene-2-carboxylate isomerase [Bacteriovoracaceae bacterium]|nr:2-hydroxychromene-2-carboxylate isomerase [Bacteriovoracaceae bacterium]
MKTVDFYFDFLSPYSYFAWLRLPELQKKFEIKIQPKPVLLAGLLNHWGQKGPAEIPAKRKYLFKDCLRYAKKNNIEFTVPLTHPFNPLYALRMGLVETAGDLQWQVIDCLYKAGWQHRIDMGNPDEILKALKEKALPADALMEKTFEKAVKNQLKLNTSEAIERDVFGVPSFVVDSEVFWGNSSIEDLELFLSGKDPLDKEKYQELLSRTASAARQVINN